MSHRLALFTTVIASIVFGCSNDKPLESNVLDNVPFIREGIIDTAFVIIHNTTDYCDWKSAQQSIQPVFEANGVKAIAHFQGLQDTNLAISIYTVDDFGKGQAYLDEKQSLQPLEQVSQANGIKVHVLDQALAYTLSSDDSIFHLMSFKTLKYERWEEAFLKDYKENPSHEFAVTNVFREVEDDNHVYMLFKVNDPQYVEKMERNNAFKMKMLAAGVVSYPVTYKLLQREI